MVSGVIIFWNWHSIIHSVISLLPILPTNSAEEPKRLSEKTDVIREHLLWVENYL